MHFVERLNVVSRCLRRRFYAIREGLLCPGRPVSGIGNTLLALSRLVRSGHRRLRRGPETGCGRLQRIGQTKYRTGNTPEGRYNHADSSKNEADTSHHKGRAIKGCSSDGRPDGTCHVAEVIPVTSKQVHNYCDRSTSHHPFP